MMPIFIFWLSAARATRPVSGTTPRAAATPATLSRLRRQRSGLPRALISVTRIGNDRYPEAEDILFLRPVHPLPEVLLPERRPGAVSRTPGVPHRSPPDSERGELACAEQAAPLHMLITATRQLCTARCLLSSLSG